MSSTRALPWFRSIFVLAALAAIAITALPVTGRGQTPGSGLRPRPANGPATAAAPSKPPLPGQHGDSTLPTLWADYIWQSIPAADLRSLTPGPVIKAYQANDWQPLFIDSRFELNRNAESLLAPLRSVDKDAIDPGPFELDKLSEVLKKLKSFRTALRTADPQFDAGRAQFFFDGTRPGASPAGPYSSREASTLTPLRPDAISKEYRRCFQAASEADVRLTTAFFLFSKEMDPFSPVEQGVKVLSGKVPISRYFAELKPKGYDYQALCSAYHKYTQLAARGDQIYVHIPYRVRTGASGKDIRRLQERLGQEGFYSGEATGVFDRATKEALRDFQAANTLGTDGLPGRSTQAGLNVSFKQKAALIAYSLNAVRSSPTRRYDRFVRVNIPQFRLDYYNKGELIKTEKVVVGRASGKKVNRQGKIVGENQTPTMVSQIDRIIFNPRWYVDGRIRLELNQKAKSNPEWFEEHGYVRMESRYAFGEHRLFQKSGPQNALGRVKFDFPNPYAVYLHDTNQRFLFGRPRRDLSHGCIRVQNALDLAQTILDEEGNPFAKRIQTTLQGTHVAYVKLSQPVPISVEYIPVVAESNGKIVFAGDPYGVVSEPNRMARKW
ncbi:MAG: L,D-transpeptidase family protein [Syntrophobacteraceae bacterium]|nr:L,D-transpeptidase family protein [Syntrophobacteraceae bacterium]